jgi:hypothetical protein
MAHTLNRRAQEQRLRRLAQRHGLRVEKSRRRTPQTEASGGDRLVDVRHNAVVYGGIPHAYGATLDEIEHFLGQLPPRPPPYSTDAAVGSHDGV